MDNSFIEIAFPGRSLIVARAGEADVNVLADWCDMHLGRDYFFRRRHVEQIIKRPTNACYAVLVDGIMAGLLILYKGSVLHNFYLSEEYRSTGIGRAILQHFLPARIRSKTNMLAGDPTAFYKKCGYVVDSPDPERPHIIDMVRPASSPGAHGGELALSPLDAAAATAASAHPASVPVLANGQLEEYEALKKKEANRVRAKEYRAKKKLQDAAAASSSPALTNDANNSTNHVENALFDPLA